MRCLILILILLHATFSPGQTISIKITDSAICLGAAASFTATGTGVAAASYQWLVNNTPVGTDSRFFTTTALADNDSISCNLLYPSLTLAAKAPAIRMSVKPRPVAGTLTFTGKDTLCTGSTTTLTASTPGGQWYSSNRYATVNNGIVTAIHADVFECHEMPSAETILYIMRNGGCTDTAAAIVTVHTKISAGFFLGTPFDYRKYVCEGGSILINAGIGPCGRLYSVYGLTDSYDGQSMYGIKPGIDSVYCVLTTRCGTTTFGTNIQVLPRTALPAVLPNIKVCKDAVVSVKLKDYPFSWRSSNGSVSITADTVQNIFKGNSPGNDTLTMYTYGTCGYASAKVIATVLPVPADIGVPGPTLCKGFSFQLSDSTAGGAWSLAQPGVATINNTGLVTTYDTGTLGIVYTMANGCSTSLVTIVNECTSPYHIIYPNPATDHIIIQQDMAGYFTHYSVVTVAGVILLAGDLNGSLKVIDVEGLAHGVYLLQLSGTHGKSVSRFARL